MFRKLIKNKKAQNTAEYALLISLVIAGVIAMQTYAQRALQGRIRDAAVYLVNQTHDLGNAVQYEPYYLRTDYTVLRDDQETILHSNVTDAKVTFTNRTRLDSGFQRQEYNTDRFPALVNGL